MALLQGFLGFLYLPKRFLKIFPSSIMKIERASKGKNREKMDIRFLFTLPVHGKGYE